jgi:hypothetical protein
MLRFIQRTNCAVVHGKSFCGLSEFRERIIVRVWKFTTGTTTDRAELFWPSIVAEMQTRNEMVLYETGLLQIV